MKFANANNLHRKSGGAHHRSCDVDGQIEAGSGKAFETYRFRPTYALATVGHPSVPMGSC
jgi:hypothetical protein